MAAIRPSSDLRNKYNKDCEQLSRIDALHQKLDEGISAMRSGAVRPAEEVFADMEKCFSLRP